MKAPKTTLFFRIYKWLTAQALKVYFGRVEVVGKENVPKDQPFILAINHQNAFLDPHVAGCFCPKTEIYSLTRGDIFNKKTTPILGLLNMLPIYRIRDGIGSLGKNEQTFSACVEIFREGNSVQIFPEANHGENHYLRPIKKGTARLAFDGQTKIDQELFVLPCGVNYYCHMLPRKKVSVVFGEPIAVRDFIQDYEESEAKGLNNLKARISEEMKKCLVIPEKTDDYDVKAQEVFSSKYESMDFHKLRELASGDFSEIELREPRKKPMVSLLIGLFSIPNLLPLLMLRKFLSGIKDKVFWGSFKYAFMVFVAPVWWAILLLVPGFLGYWSLGGVLVLVSVISFFVRAELRKSIKAV